MFDNKDYNQLKEIYSRISKALDKYEPIKDIKTIGGVDIIFKGDRCLCVFVVYDYETLNLIEKKEHYCKESMPYSPRWYAAREGNLIIETFNLLDNKPDILMIESIGNIDDKRIETGSYVGVIINKPVIAIAQNLIYGTISENKVMFSDEIKGFVLETKKFARPVYISSAFKITIEQALEIIKHSVNNHWS
jgi:deoxyribonuclease V